jgi:hypothetical protein
VQEYNGRRLTSRYQTAGQGGERWYFVTAGNVSITSIRFVSSSNRTLDFILAACDVEGNFLVVKAYQYTDLLSCMLLDAWVSSLLHQFPLLNASVEQMGDPDVPVLLVVVHADQVHLDPTRCMGLSLHLRHPVSH